MKIFMRTGLKNKKSYYLFPEFYKDNTCFLYSVVTATLSMYADQSALPVLLELSLPNKQVANVKHLILYIRLSKEKSIFKISV